MLISTLGFRHSEYYIRSEIYIDLSHTTYRGYINSSHRKLTYDSHISNITNILKDGLIRSSHIKSSKAE